MRGVNHVFLIGTLGRDPEIIYIEGNIPVAKFPLATTESFKDKKGISVPQTEWHHIVLWRGLAELAVKYLHKGSLVHIEGSLRTRSWEDKDKNKRSITEVIASNLVMLDKRGTEIKSEFENIQTQHNDNQASIAPTLVNDLADELPF